MTDITAAFNVPTSGVLTLGDSGTGMSNAGQSGLLFSQGGNSDVSSAVIAPTGNSVLDGLANLATIGVNDVSKAFQTYGSFLETNAVANAANRLGTTPAAVAQGLPNVPLTNGVSATDQKTFLYIGVAAIAAVVLISVLKKRR